MAEPCTGAAKVMGSHPVDGSLPGALAARPKTCCACLILTTPRLRFCKALDRLRRNVPTPSPSMTSLPGTAPNLDWHSVAASFSDTATSWKPGGLPQQP